MVETRISGTGTGNVTYTKDLKDYDKRSGRLIRKLELAPATVPLLSAHRGASTMPPDYSSKFSNADKITSTTLVQ